MWMDSQTAEVTRLLRAWGGGDQAALDQLTPLVYAELRRMAGRYMQRENPGNTLQATALVNEAFLRLVDVTGIRWQDRAHFFAISASLMRRILVDFARTYQSQKRGAGVRPASLDDGLDVAEERLDLTVLDDALKTLAALDPRKSRVVELRFFGGLSIEEAAEVLQVSPETVKRDWKLAKAWLLREMGGKQDAIQTLEAS